MMSQWTDLAEKVQGTGGCKVDPATKKIVCERKEECWGGSHVRESFTAVTRTLEYDCGSKCEGPLLIDCCQTCAGVAQNPSSLGVNNIRCKGCGDKSKLERLASKARCDVQDGEFRCSSVGHCDVGHPSQTCEDIHYKCHIFPCNNCRDQTLQAKCCEVCLHRVCSQTPDTVILCQGCDELPGRSWRWMPWR